jgi:AraC-like DNA-binding protein
LSVLTTVYFQFRPELLGGFLTVHERTRAERAGGRRGLSRVFGARHEVAQEFKAICGPGSDLNGPITRSRLLQLAVTVLLEPSAAAPARDAVFLPASKRAEVLLRKVSEAELLDYSAEDLATRCGCSLRHMNKLLRDMFGVSLRAKQREIRLIKAKQLLAETTRRVADVARECGFGEQTSFSMEFKRRFGVTPTAWREQCGADTMRNGHGEGESRGGFVTYL